MRLGSDLIGCIENTIRLCSGHYLDVTKPDPELLTVRVIARALSRLCRYGGHSPDFYSVAEHCVHCFDAYVRHETKPIFANEVLLHDAGKAFGLGDVLKPVKNLMPDYQKLERIIEDAIADKFALQVARAYYDVKRYDIAMLKAERRAFWPNDRRDWGLEGVVDLEVNFQFWQPHQAEVEFMRRYQSIRGPRDADS